MVVMAAQRCKCALDHWAVCLQMVKTVDFTLCITYHNEKSGKWHWIFQNRRQQGSWHMTWPPALISPRFPTFSSSWLDEFSLRELPCVLTWVQWQTLVLWEGSPPPPSWHLEYLSLPACSTLPWTHKCVSPHLVCTCPSSPCHREGTGRCSDCRYQCADHSGSPKFSFKNTACL